VNDTEELAAILRCDLEDFVSWPRIMTRSQRLG